MKKPKQIAKAINKLMMTLGRIHHQHAHRKLTNSLQPHAQLLLNKPQLRNPPRHTKKEVIISSSTAKLITPEQKTVQASQPT